MKLGDSFELFAESDGLRLKTINPALHKDVTGSASQFISSLSSLKADSIFEPDGNDLFASLERLVELEAREIDPLAFLIEWSPFALKIEGKGSIGFDDFKFVPTFYFTVVRCFGSSRW